MKRPLSINITQARKKKGWSQEYPVFSANMKKARLIKGWSQEGASVAISEASGSTFKRASLGAIEEGRIKTVKYNIQKAIMEVYSIDDFDSFFTNPKYFEDEITAEEIKSRFDRLEPSAKKAIRLLLGF